jgi:hypothetical protein
MFSQPELQAARLQPRRPLAGTTKRSVEVSGDTRECGDRKGSDAVDRRPHQEATGKGVKWALMPRRRHFDQPSIEPAKSCSVECAPPPGLKQPKCDKVPAIYHLCQYVFQVLHLQHLSCSHTENCRMVHANPLSKSIRPATTKAGPAIAR